MQVETRSWNPFRSSPKPDQSKNIMTCEKYRRPVTDKLILYQYATCPFCNKVKVYLDYYGIPYSKVEVQPKPKPQMKWLKDKPKKVPTLRVFEDQSGSSSEVVLQESSLIISLLHSFQLDATGNETFQSLSDHYNSITANAEDKSAKYTIKNYGIEDQEKFRNELKWRQWADDKLVHVIAPNIYRSGTEALDSFRTITQKGYYGDDKWWGRLYKFSAEMLGSTAMYYLCKYKLNKKYNLKEDVRESLTDDVNEWLTELGSKKFHGGDKPDLADLAVYGTLKSMEDMDAFSDMISQTKISTWYGRMMKVCQ